MLKHFIVTLFLSAPASIIPLLDNTARLDLLDYYEAKMPAKMQNRFGGMTELTHLSDTLIALRMTEASSLELRLQADSTIQMTRIIALPEKELRISKLFSANWEEIK